jgi:hypothetical protein
VILQLPDRASNHVNTFGQQPIECPEAHYVLALTAMQDDEVYASGSAVLVAPHLALTARHVTDDFTRLYHAPSDTTPSKADYHILARCFFRNRWWIFHVRHIHATFGTDIVARYVSLAPDQPQDFEWPRIMLDMFPPKRWRRVWSWGHIAPGARFADYERGEIHWYAALHRSSGIIRDIFPRQRDRGFVNFPAFQFDARVDPSMSGGPIFNDLGHLIGINSTSLAATAEHPEHVSTGALIWPVPALPFAKNDETFTDAEEIRFVEDLRALGYLDVTNHVFVEVDRTVAEGQLVVSLRLPGDRH